MSAAHDLLPCRNTELYGKALWPKSQSEDSFAITASAWNESWLGLQRRSVETLTQGHGAGETHVRLTSREGWALVIVRVHLHETRRDCCTCRLVCGTCGCAHASGPPDPERKSYRYVGCCVSGYAVVPGFWSTSKPEYNRDSPSSISDCRSHDPKTGLSVAYGSQSRTSLPTLVKSMP